MREGSAALLRCPHCGGERGFEVSASESDEREIREGTLTCRACEERYAISEGIADLLRDPPEFVRREAAGLERFAQVMRDDGWDRARIRSLPYVELPYWWCQRVGMEMLLEQIDFKPGERLLDVGANTCWASNIFAQRGLDVIALDIAKAEMQGLRTAEYFIDQPGVFFERVLSAMFDLPLASGSMDYVFCCEVLHHNDLGNLRRTFREIHRVLRPGGRLLVINEPLRFPLKLKRDHGQEVAEFEGNEHVFFFHQYYLAARRAGFTVSVHEPPSDPFFRPWSTTIGPEMTFSKATRTIAYMAIKRNRLVRRSVMAYKTLLAGDVSLFLTAGKSS